VLSLVYADDLENGKGIGRELREWARIFCGCWLKIDAYAIKVWDQEDNIEIISGPIKKRFAPIRAKFAAKFLAFAGAIACRLSREKGSLAWLGI
jgi:phosphosulfolactate phosphohydrolase-like enzyme